MHPSGSDGEHQLQHEYGTASRAAAFYERQMLEHLNARMREFIGAMEMMFVATADTKGECDCSLRAGLPGFVHVLDDRTLAWPEYRGNGVMASLGNLAENPHVGLWFGDFFGSTVGLHVNGRARIVENAVMVRLVHPSKEDGTGASDWPGESNPSPRSLDEPDRSAPSDRSDTSEMSDRPDPSDVPGRTAAPETTGSEKGSRVPFPEFPADLPAEIREALRRDLEAKQGRAPERWVLVTVEEAYIHCSKHVPKLQKLDKSLHWGTDDDRHKGGDFFDVGRNL